MAIGKEGQNVRLAAKLTGWKIDVRSVSQLQSDAIPKEQTADVEELEDETEAETKPEIEAPKDQPNEPNS